jgi:hypothetical protein
MGPYQMGLDPAKCGVFEAGFPSDSMADWIGLDLYAKHRSTFIKLIR